MGKIGKKLLAVTVIGAAAAGAYYYLNKKDVNVSENAEDDEDFDNFEGEAEDTGAEAAKEKRSYVNLDFNTIEEKAKDAVNKVADVASKASATIGDFVVQAEGKVEEFFNDKKEVVCEASEETCEEVKEACEEIKEEACEEVKENIEE